MLFYLKFIKTFIFSMMLWFWNEVDLIRSWHTVLNTSWCSPDDGDNSMVPIISHHHQIITHSTFVTSSSVKNSKQCSKPSSGPFPAYCHQEEAAAVFETHNNHHQRGGSHWTEPPFTIYMQPVPVVSCVKGRQAWVIFPPHSSHAELSHEG